MILPPLPGNPDGIRLLADRLDSTARRTAAITGVLARLRGSATWVSPAGEAFGARLGEVPPVLDAVSARLGGAAGPLRSLADAMEEAQRVVEGAIRDDSDAQATYAVLEDRAYALVVHRVGRGLTGRPRRAAPAAGAAAGAGGGAGAARGGLRAVPRGRPPVLGNPAGAVG